MFYAMLFGGDWSGSHYKNALVNYLRIETGYIESDCELYIDAVKKYEEYEMNYICSERFGMTHNRMLTSREFVEEETGFSSIQISRLAEAEDCFHTLLSKSYDRISMLLAA